MDAAETYERNQTSFAQLPDTLQQFLLIVSGAAEVPMTRFLGQSPAGMSSTGDGDMKNYYDKIQSIQMLEIGPAMYRFEKTHKILPINRTIHFKFFYNYVWLC